MPQRKNPARKRLRTTLVALAALPIAASSIAITAPTASAIDGYHEPGPWNKYAAKGVALEIANLSFYDNITHNPSALTRSAFPNGLPDLLRWTSLIEDTLGQPDPQQTFYMANPNLRGIRGAGYAVASAYFRHIPNAPAGVGMIVVHNRFDDADAQAFVGTVNQFNEMAQRLAIPTGVPLACPPYTSTPGTLSKANAASGTPTPKTNSPGTKASAKVTTPSSSHTTKQKSNSAPPCESLLSEVKPAMTPDGDQWAVLLDNTVAVKHNSAWVLPKDSNNTRVTAIATDMSAHDSNKLFAKTVDNHLVYRDGANDDWHDLGGDIVTDPVAETHTVNGKKEQWVWGADSNGTLWERDTAAGSSWIRMPALPGGAMVVSAPANANDSGGSSWSEFVTDSKGGMDQLTTFDGGVSWRWKAWGNAGTPLKSNLSVIQTPGPGHAGAKGSVWVSGIDNDGALQEWWWNVPGAGGGWTRQPVAMSKAIAAAPLQGISNLYSPAVGTHIARVTGTDGSVRTYYTQDGTTGSLITSANPAEGKIVSPCGANPFGGASYTESYCVDEKGNLQKETDKSAPPTSGSVTWENLGHP